MNRGRASVGEATTVMSAGRHEGFAGTDPDRRRPYLSAPPTAKLADRCAWAASPARASRAVPHPKHLTEHGEPTKVTLIELDVLAPDWIPTARNPEELYAAYCGEGDVSRIAREAMQQELRTIGAPTGLSREEFRTWVGASLSGSVLVGSVLQRIDEIGQMTEAELANVMGGMGLAAEDREAREVLEVLERWLTCFLPTEYETARDSVKLVRSRRL